MEVSMTAAEAEILALKALAFLANSEDGLNRLCNASGLNAGDLRAQAGEPGTLAAILDFLLQNEELLVAFCDDATIDPRAVHRAAYRLATP